MTARRRSREFALIDRHFTALGVTRPDVVIGVGDDAAVLHPPAGMDLVLCTDTLVAGRHFPHATPAEAVGHRALAVNLSDLAAMGAEPAWALLALTVPEDDAEWLAAFAAGMDALARSHGVAIVGGDTTRGDLAVTVTAAGLVPTGEALRRDTAVAGDHVLVTGELGLAALGLATLGGEIALDPQESQAAMDRLYRPQPAVDAGIALRGLAHAVIDISDGLAADLGHVLEQSGVGATLSPAELPVATALRRHGREALAWSFGDDYELCVTVPAEHLDAAVHAIEGCGRRVSTIGRCESQPGLRGLPQAGREGWDHFEP